MQRYLSCSLIIAVSLLALPGVAISQVPSQLPGSVDAGRIDQREKRITPGPSVATPSKSETVMPEITPPAQSKHITMTLRAVKITGMTAFTSAQVEDIYSPYIGRVITMDTLWLIAGQMTERYRQAGYFLSQVTVPEQEIKDDVVRLHVVEGYIGDIQFNDKKARKPLVKKWLSKLQSYRPLTTDQLESALLQLNDLPGISLRAVLEPMKDVKAPGAVRLVLEHREKSQYSGQINFDNNGSLFLGPYQMSAHLQATLLPMQKTTFMVLTTRPTNELKYGSIRHEIAVLPGGTLEAYASRTHAAPGDTLAIQEIRSDSTLLGAAFRYQFLRQRQQNLSGLVALESRNTQSDILGTPLTRDAVRAVRGTLDYEVADNWRGYNLISVTFSRGVDAFGASKANALNLSRAEATPDFRKLQANVSRIQSITPEWILTAASAMQKASGPLYSSEEFGYGGQSFGRAYDDSEITGDHGFAVMAELKYNGLSTWNGLQAVPYGFYDIGLVWNEDQEQTRRAVGSSGGTGVRLTSENGFTADFGMAFPLAREIAKPLYGNEKNPRYRMKISYGF